MSPAVRKKAETLFRSLPSISVDDVMRQLKIAERDRWIVRGIKEAAR